LVPKKFYFEELPRELKAFPELGLYHGVEKKYVDFLTKNSYSLCLPVLKARFHVCVSFLMFYPIEYRNNFIEPTDIVRYLLQIDL
jgi:hypothetical protein